MSIFIGGAWPYANGSLHLGHIASLLPGDIVARYYRLKGEDVLYVSGSDCNGTPIAIRAKQSSVTPREIADQYHTEFRECFKKLGFSYDIYSRTDTPQHHQVVQEIFLKLLENDMVYKKKIEQAYCETCEQFLPDRFVEGRCPNCLCDARGDQCDHCSKILEPLDLLDKKCKICGDTPVVRETEHFYFKLSALQEEIQSYISKAKTEGLWRENAVKLSERYVREGLQDRAVSRDLPIGVSVPVTGYEDKKIYVWIEAVAGYYSASKKWAEDNNEQVEHFWSKGTTSYYVHGKDNIPFHSIIWPAVLMGVNVEALPTKIVSNEYLTLEKKKLSTSKNWAVWIPDVVDRYHPDSIRYFLTINAPENRDTDFSFREFIYSHNSELLGAYGNFVNRTLKFIEKSFGGEVPKGEVDDEILASVKHLYKKVGSQIENTHFKDALEDLFSFIRDSNKYFDQKQPWVQIQESKLACQHTLATCVYIILNLAQLLSPFLPFSSREVQRILRCNEMQWNPIDYQGGNLNNVRPLFERIDVAEIEREVERLHLNSSI